MNKLIFLICWQGNYPWYFPYFLHSCRYNQTIDLMKNYNEIIQYFNSEEGENCFCRSRIIIIKNRIDPFLFDRDISSSKKQESSKE